MSDADWIAIFFIIVSLLMGMVLGILATFRRLRQLGNIRIGDWMYRAEELPSYKKE
jgi:uncharacterized protein YneF (UPF0154 family)